MGEGLISLCHPMGVFALLHCISPVFSGILQLTRQALFHGIFPAGHAPP